MNKNILLPCCIFASILTGCASVVPYDSTFQCPKGPNGTCESVEDAYTDSLHGITPGTFNKDFQKNRQKWAEANSDLIEARKEFGDEYKPESLGKLKNSQDPNIDLKSQPIIDASKVARDSLPGKEVDYRGALFDQYRSLLAKPETPIIVPPTPRRALILDSTSGQDGLVYTPPHYVYFLIDKPRWILKKLSESQPSLKAVDKSVAVPVNENQDQHQKAQLDAAKEINDFIYGE